MTNMLEFNRATVTALAVCQEAKDALLAALATRGARKGFLLSKAPPSHTMANVAWQAAQLSCNPFKVSIGALIFFTPEQRKLQNEITEALDALPKGRRLALDKDRLQLERLGVW